MVLTFNDYKFNFTWPWVASGSHIGQCSSSEFEVWSQYLIRVNISKKVEMLFNRTECSFLACLGFIKVYLTHFATHLWLRIPEGSTFNTKFLSDFWEIQSCHLNGALNQPPRQWSSWNRLATWVALSLLAPALSFISNLMQSSPILESILTKAGRKYSPTFQITGPTRYLLNLGLHLIPAMFILSVGLSATQAPCSCSCLIPALSSSLHFVAMRKPHHQLLEDSPFNCTNAILWELQQHDPLTRPTLLSFSGHPMCFLDVHLHSETGPWTTPLEGERGPHEMPFLASVTQLAPGRESSCLLILGGLPCKLSK